MKGDYSQAGDPYGIEQEYSAQSAATVATSPKKPSSGQGDERGNTLMTPRGIPTQAEVDAILYRRRYVKRIDQGNQSDS
jgi:hypothetical protein